MTTLLLCCLLVAADFHFQSQEIDTSLTVGYAVRVGDINQDGKLDVVVLDSKRLLWYENPSWKPHVILDGGTPPDNVALALHDVNGDGKLDAAIGCDWQFGPKNVGPVYWLEQTAPDRPWRLHPIAEVPFVHRMQWADVDGDGQPELVAVPLLASTARPEDRQKTPVRIMAFKKPANPASERWHPIVIDQSLHVCHQFLFADIEGSGQKDLVTASFEGLTRFRRNGEQWKSELLATGDQASTPNRGCSEVAFTRTKGYSAFATIEPWHGNKVVAYERAGDAGAWHRKILDDELQWGHAVAWTDVDGDGNAELIAGVRDDKSPTQRRGVRVYRRQPTGEWSRQQLEAGAVAVEDLVVADLDGDQRPDLVTSGRQTKNVRIYWNRTPRKGTVEIKTP